MAAITRDDLVTLVAERLAALVVADERTPVQLAAALWPEKTEAARERKLYRAMAGDVLRLPDLADFARVFGVRPGDLLR